MINNFLHVEYVISLILLSPLEDAFDLDLGRIQCSLESTTLGKTKWQGEIWSQSERFKYKKWYSCVSTSNNFPPPHPYLKIQKNESETDWLWGNILQYKVHVSQTNNLIRCDGW